MDQEPKINIVKKENTAVIEINGDVTTFAEKPINKAYESPAVAGSKNVLLKFSKESFINSAGIAIIIGLVNESRKKKQEFAVCGLSGHFEKIFDMIGLTDYLTIYPSEDKALKNFSAR